MSAKHIGDETSVFTFGNLAYEGVTVRPADVYAVPSRPVRYVPAEKTEKREFPVYPVLVLGTFCAVALLLLTLLGQIRITKLNDRTAEAETALTQLQESNRLLQIRAEQHSDFTIFTLNNDTAPEDTATVLHVRRGSRLTEGWDMVVDAVADCFH